MRTVTASLLSSIVTVIAKAYDNWAAEHLGPYRETVALFYHRAAAEKEDFGRSARDTADQREVPWGRDEDGDSVK